MARQIYNEFEKVDGVNIFYREAGHRRNSFILLLHGFPTSSLMFKNLMTALSDDFRLVAPDYPGFGFSDFPSPTSAYFLPVLICLCYLINSLTLILAPQYSGDIFLILLFSLIEELSFSLWLIIKGVRKVE